jgi:hypothetical protein
MWMGIPPCRSLLAAASKYFCRRLEAWDADLWSLTGDDGKPLLVVGVEEGLHEAAAAVVRVMYEEVVPGGTPALQLAKVCTGVVCTAVLALLPSQALVRGRHGCAAGCWLIMAGNALHPAQECLLFHMLCRCAE